MPNPKDALPDGATPVKVEVGPLDIPAVVPKKAAEKAGYFYTRL